MGENKEPTHADIYREVGVMRVSLDEHKRSFETFKVDHKAAHDTMSRRIYELQESTTARLAFVKGVVISTIVLWAIIGFFRDPIVRWLSGT